MRQSHFPSLWRLLVLGAGLYLQALSTLAAGPEPLPGEFDPAQIERPIEAIRLPESRPAPARLPEPATVRAELAEQSFTLAGVLIEGGTVYSNLDFLPYYRPFLGREVTVKDLRAIAEAIARRYRKDGYFLSSAFLPAQNIEFGIVRIRVVEGYVERWRLTEEGLASDPLIVRELESIAGQRPSRRSDLLAALKRINDLPDVTIRPDLHALPDAFGAYELLLSVDRETYEGGLTIDNRGSERIGPWRAIAFLKAFNIARRHESYQLKLATTSNTEELGYADASTEWWFGPRGLRLQLGASYVRSQPGADIEPFDVRVLNRRYRLGLIYPLWRTAGSESDVGVSLDRYHSKTDVQDAKRLEDRLTSMNVNYRQAWTGDGRVQAVNLALMQGLALGEVETMDTQGEGIGKPTFTKTKANYAFRRRDERWELSILLDGQYAADELPSSERYSIGGSPFGSAYDPSEITGDHGLAGRIELSRNWRMRDFWRASPYVAYDLGAVWRISDLQEERASAASLSVGIRTAGRGLSLSIELAKPLTRSVASQGDDGKDARLFASAGRRF